MNKRTKIVAVGGVVAALVAGAGAVAVAGSGGDSEQPIAGSTLEKAETAALDHVGGGTVTDTEVGDEESVYEVEVTRADGRQVDVQLDRDFDVVGTELDGDDEESES